MSKVRVIARIDVKNEFAIKGIHLEGLRKVGNPNNLAKRYYDDGVDEIIFMDAVAAYYDRNSLSHIIEKACHDVFVPITVGGGIRNVRDISNALQAGADKVAINTQAVNTPEFVQESAQIFGSQCIVGSIDAKRTSSGKWEAYTDNGREPTGLDVIEWAKKLETLGVGELMLTSIDSEGTKKGFDINLVSRVLDAVGIPVIVCGGAGCSEHVTQLCKETKPDAITAASIFHYDLVKVYELKQALQDENVEVRNG